MVMIHVLRLLPLVWLLACTGPADAQSDASSKPRSPGQRAASLDRPAEEFRAAWVATVDNIDFPSEKGLSVRALKRELDQIVARAVALRLNALIFQVRSCGDALYPSPLEPWAEWLTGKQGQAPAGGFDPLAYVIERSHASGLQLHAWFNPFRCWHHACKSQPAPEHVTVRAPQLTWRYGRYQWMDPGHPTARKWTLAVIQDVVRRYDIDGVHLDDYFYPYPEGGKDFPDDKTWRDYRAQGGTASRGDWRRQNIDRFVERLYELVHDEKPWLMVGISPFGIARPGVPAGIEAGLDQYADIYADVPKWLRNGWCDYLTPQLYWPIDQAPQAFGKLLAYWHRANTMGRAIWPGIATYRIREARANVRPTELRDEILLTRRAAAQRPGHVHFSFKSLRGDHALVARPLREEIYTQPASVPRLPWLPAKP